jgi:hypothetical protein
MKCLFFALSMMASCAVQAATPAKHCGKLAPTDEVSGPLTIAGIERQEAAALSEHLKVRPDYPKVPFGFMNAEWTAFKSQFRPGDTIVGYSTDRHSWQNLAGEAGYALMRSGCLIAQFKTMWN